MKKLFFIPIVSIFILSLNSCQKDPVDFQGNGNSINEMNNSQMDGASN